MSAVMKQLEWRYDAEVCMMELTDSVEMAQLPWDQSIQLWICRMKSKEWRASNMHGHWSTPITSGNVHHLIRRFQQKDTSLILSLPNPLLYSCLHLYKAFSHWLNNCGHSVLTLGQPSYPLGGTTMLHSPSVLPLGCALTPWPIAI